MARRGWDAARSAELARRAAMIEHASLADALVAALSELTVIEPVNTANAGSYSYSYANVGDVVKKTRPVLAEHGVVALTPIVSHGDGLACNVILLHASGDKLELGPFPFPHGRDAQATGSMVTYHRRYALVAALGMAAGDDDDGASAAPRSQETPEPARGGRERRCEVCKDVIVGDVKPLGPGKYAHPDCVEPLPVEGSDSKKDEAQG